MEWTNLTNQSLRVLLLLMLVFAASPAKAQFSSGSTGADGAFNPVTSNTLQIPASGVFNFTTVNIPQGVEIRFTKNAKNTPVTILATGNVVIGGGRFFYRAGRGGRCGGGG